MPHFDTSSAQIGDSLEEYLIDATQDTKLRQILMSLAEATRTIAFKVRPATCFITAPGWQA